jgi:RNA polymerase sigma-70 factor, ECF subfamily
MESRRPRLSPVPIAGDPRPGAARASTNAPDERRLVGAASTGSAAAFRELYRRHLPIVHGRLALMIGPGPQRDDLVQQIFLDAYRALFRFRGDARFATYLNRIAVNLACDHLGRRRRNRSRHAPLAETEIDRLVAPGAVPASRASHRQELAQAFAHLEAIRAKKRIAFVLVAVQGMSLDEAAELLDASAETVKQLVLRARKEIAVRIADSVEAQVIAPLRNAHLAPDDLQVARLSAALDTALQAVVRRARGQTPPRRRARWVVGLALVTAAVATLIAGPSLRRAPPPHAPERARPSP